MNPHTYTLHPLYSSYLFLFFLLFLVVAWVINAVLKRKIVNGAMFFLFAEGILFIIHFANALRLQIDAHGLGEIIGTHLPSALLGIYLARRFENQKNVPKTINIEPQQPKGTPLSDKK